MAVPPGDVVRQDAVDGGEGAADHHVAAGQLNNSVHDAGETHAQTAPRLPIPSGNAAGGLSPTRLKLPPATRLPSGMSRSGGDGRV